MSLYLQLLATVQALDASTITARNKAVKTLKELLKSPKALGLLDKYTEEGDALHEDQRLDWPVVIRKALLFAHKEAGQAGARKREGGSLLRLLVQTADDPERNSPPMMLLGCFEEGVGKSLFTVIRKMLGNAACVEAYGPDLHWTLSHLLDSRIYMSHLRLSDAIKLLSLYLSELDRKQRDSTVVVAKVFRKLFAQLPELTIEKVIKNSGQRVALEAFFARLFDDHLKIIEATNEGRALPVSALTEVLGALNIFARAVALESRDAFFRIWRPLDRGKPTGLLCLGALLNWKGASKELREQVVEALLLVESIYYPPVGKAKTLPIITHLYDGSLSALELVPTNRRSTKRHQQLAVLDYPVARHLLLAAKVFVHWEQRRVRDGNASVEASGQKRRRVEHKGIWEHIDGRLQLHSDRQSDAVLLWLQFLAVLSECGGAAATRPAEALCRSILSHLVRHLQKAKPAVGAWAMRCLRNLCGDTAQPWLEPQARAAVHPAVAQAAISKLRERVPGDVQKLRGFELLSILVAVGGLHLGTEAWKLQDFKAELSKPTFASLSFAGAFLQRSPCPKAGNLRQQLLTWALSFETSARDASGLCPNTWLLATVIVLLCQRHPPRPATAGAVAPRAPAAFLRDDPEVPDRERAAGEDLATLHRAYRLDHALGPSDKEGHGCGPVPTLTTWPTLEEACAGVVAAGLPPGLEGPTRLMCERLADRMLAVQEFHVPESYNVERSGQVTLEHLRGVAVTLAVSSKVLALLTPAQLASEAPGSPCQTLLEAHRALANFLAGQLTMVAEKCRTHSFSLPALGALVRAVHDVFVAGADDADAPQTTRASAEEARSAAALIGSIYQGPLLGGALPKLRKASCALLSGLMSEHRRDNVQAKAFLADDMMDADFESAVPTVTGGAGGGPADAEDFDVLPTKPINKVRVACVELLQALRCIQFLHPALAAGTTPGAGKEEEDTIGLLFCDLLKDITTPLFVAMALCGSLMAVPSALGADRVRHVEVVLRCVVDPDFNALMEDVYFHEPKFRVRVLELVSLAVLHVPAIRYDAGNPCPMIVKDVLLPFLQLLEPAAPALERERLSPLSLTALSARTRKAFGACLVACLQTDPAYGWLGDDGAADFKAGFVLARLLRDRNHSVRTFACRLLGPTFAVLPQHLGALLFEEVERRLRVVLALFSDDDEEDETTNEIDYPADEHKHGDWERTHHLQTAILGLGELAKAWPNLEKHSVFLLCREHKGSNQGLVGRVLEAVSTRLGYSSLQSFMSACLPYLIRHWLRSNEWVYRQDHNSLLHTPFWTFPIQLVDEAYAYEGCSDERRGLRRSMPPVAMQAYCRFFDDQMHILLPTLIRFQAMAGDWYFLQEISNYVEKTLSALILEHLPKIMAFLLPVPQDEGFPSSTRKAANKFLSGTLHPKAGLSDDEFRRATAACAELIVTHLLLLIRDPQLNSATAIESDPVAFAAPVVDKCIALIQTRFHGKQPGAPMMFARHLGQRVLLVFALRLHGEHRTAERLQLFGAFEFTVRALLNADAALCRRGAKQALGASGPFYLRDVVATVARCLRDPELFDGACSLLLSLCEDAARHCPGELAQLLHRIMGALLPLAPLSEDDAEGLKRWQQSSAPSIARLLVTDAFAEQLRELDPFPDSPVLRDERRTHLAIRGTSTLQVDLARFLHSGTTDATVTTAAAAAAVHATRPGTSPGLGPDRAPPPAGSRVSALEHLLEQLRAKKAQVDAVPVDLVHQLLRALKLVADTASPQAQALAASCLGELGAIDLETIALVTGDASVGGKPTAGAAAEPLVAAKYPKRAASPELQRWQVLVPLLYEQLVDDNVNVASAAALSLRELLQAVDKHEAVVSARLGPFLRKHAFHVAIPNVLLDLADYELGVATTDAQLFDWDSLWSPVGRPFGAWLRSLTCALLLHGGAAQGGVSPTLRVLLPVCHEHPGFCRRVLGFVVHDILSNDPLGEHRKTLSALVERILKLVAARAEGVELDCGRALIGVVNFLRGCDRIPSVRIAGTRRERGVPHTSWENNRWLDLDYGTVARAAIATGAYFTALYYGEMGCESVDTAAVQKEFFPGLVYSYTQIGEPDSLYGCDSRFDELSLVHTFEHEGSWERACGVRDLALQRRDARVAPPQAQQQGHAARRGVCRSLHAMGMAHVLTTYIDGLRQSAAFDDEELEAASLVDYQFEAAWRQTLWTAAVAAPATIDTSQASFSFHRMVLTALHGMQSFDADRVKVAIRGARQHLICLLKDNSFESACTLLPVLVQLQSLTEIEECWAVCHGEALRSLQCTPIDSSGMHWDPKPEAALVRLQRLSEVWTARLDTMDQSFELIEPILSLRCVLLKIVETSDACGSDAQLRLQTTQLLVDTLLRQAQAGRSTQHFQTAHGAVAVLKAMPEAAGHHWMLEQAKTLWQQNDQALAKRLLQALLGKAEVSGLPPGLLAVALKLMGQWLAESCAQSPNIIVSDYLEKSVQLFEEQGTASEDVLDAHHVLADYADSQFKSIEEAMESSEYLESKRLREHHKNELDGLKVRKTKDAETRFRIRILEKRHNLETIEEERTQSSRRRFLVLALEHYVNCLCAGSKYDLVIFRLCSLWFQNSQDSGVMEIIENRWLEINSHKWLPLMYQLAARLSKAKTNFQDSLKKVIERTAWEHPHHVLFVLIALKNGQHTGTRAKSRRNSVDQDKILAAATALATLKRMKAPTAQTEHRRLSIPALISAMDKVAAAYMQLADLDVKEHKSNPKYFENKFDLARANKRIADLSAVAVVTDQVAMDPTCQYQGVRTIDKFSSSFTFAGGVNLPKILDCVRSDGTRTRQLVKGRDDMRQDAVMQQVFRMVNAWLASRQETKQRRLNIRTYTVVPLSPQSGVLEWCNGTIPLGTWLVRGTNPVAAHQRYRPQDWPSDRKCRKLFKDAKPFKNEQEKRAPNSTWSVYQQICSNFKPVMRRFFTEKFQDPASWFERRLAYTRSVASSSIIGFVLGLGDRHPQNILIDERTAELVHIDLGVAFDQGSLLNTPETIPFRLTRDIVDGMGVTGVEGVYRRCCEKTLEVLRLNQSSLLTIIEVFLFDPLFSWKVDTDKALKLQPLEEGPDGTPMEFAVQSIPTGFGGRGGSSSDLQVRNKEAYRVLLQVTRKLQGLESSAAPLSVAGHVNHLIQEALSEDNLCRVFYGWQPWI